MQLPSCLGVLPQLSALVGCRALDVGGHHAAFVPQDHQGEKPFRQGFVPLEAEGQFRGGRRVEDHEIRFLARGDRTIDQMVQAARSGKQNIIEGNSAAMTSKEMGIKLTNVARASLDELLEDYLDFLRVRDLPLWPPESREALYVRDLGRRKPQTYDLYRGFVDTRDAAIVANIAICLIFQARYLLDRQLLSQGNAFIEKGGLRERMTQARQQHRGW